jgi:UDP-GlcNAc:undecaprenyl-phosphate GlcNAc-1-phosphate transferase
MELGNWDYLAVFVATTLLASVLTPIALRLALRRQVLDHPNEIKAQGSPVPYLGGLALVGAFGLALVIAALVRPPEGGAQELVVIVGLAIGLAVVGLVDDLRGLGPYVRLAAEAGAAVVVWISADGTRLFFDDRLDFVVTIVWIVGVTNALNLLDNMDGLSAGVAAIAAGWFFVIAAGNGQFLVATLAVALAGCAVGFLRHNFEPARIYMGDAGSLFLGFMLAVIGIKLRFDGDTQVTFFVPIVVLGVPLFDTVLVTVSRLIHGRSPLSGGRDHTSHRLVFVGIPVVATVLLIYVGALSLGCLAVVIANIDRGPAYVLMVWTVSVAVVLGVLLSRIPVYESSRRRHLMLLEVRKHESADGDDADAL